MDDEDLGRVRPAWAPDVRIPPSGSVVRPRSREREEEPAPPPQKGSALRALTVALGLYLLTAGGCSVLKQANQGEKQACWDYQVSAGTRPKTARPPDADLGPAAFLLGLGVTLLWVGAPSDRRWP